MKSLGFILLFSALFLLFVAPSQSLAQTTDWTSTGCVSPEGVATLSCIPVVMQNIINFLIAFAGVVCVFIVIFSGVKFVTSEGDPEKVASARKTALYGIGGFVLVLLSFMVMNLLSAVTGVTQIGPTP